MYCNKCGNKINENIKFCNVCGNKIENIKENVEIINTEEKKKSYAWVFIVLGVLVGIIAIVLLFLISKFSNRPSKELENALNNFVINGESSGTIDINLFIDNKTVDDYDFSANIKYIKKYNENYHISFKLNKTKLFDEINLYSKVSDDTIILYAPSNLIDMLGLTKSTDDMWVYYKFNEDEMNISDEFEFEDDDRFELSNVLDEEHYKLINEENGLKHYQLTVDNELLNKLKNQADSEEEKIEFEESLKRINGGSTELKDIYYLDIYINNKGELKKLEMDLTKFMEDEEINKCLISMEFSDFGSTSLTIPSKVFDSNLDLETYLNKFSLFNEPETEESTNSIYYNNYDAYLKGDYYNPNYYYGGA